MHESPGMQGYGDRFYVDKGLAKRTSEAGLKANGRGVSKKLEMKAQDKWRT